MEYRVDMAPGQNPHVDYEPSTLGGLVEAPKRGKDHEPHYDAKLIREKIQRTNDFAQAGQTYRAFDEVEREELISNLVGALKVCRPHIQEQMISHFTQADADYGKRVREGLERAKQEMGHTSSAAADAAAKRADGMGHESDRY
ncbi:catalase-related domain-containing protein [Paenibacillus chartarius]|uniref:catalase n=1 Tax=Paenibacillus chartarius TaxID=747481 RepID=A0ABV6DLK3_9BACL